jgi:hypothetical protein
MQLAANNGTPLYANRQGTDGDIIDFRKSGTAVGSIGSFASGNYLYIGSGDTGLVFAPNIDAIIPYSTTASNYNGNVDLGYGGGTRFKDLYLSGGVKGNNLTFSGNGSAEHARIDTSGNMLVGTTDTSLYNNGAGGDTGLVFEPSGTIQFAKSNNICAHLNRLDSDGQIINFRKNGTLVGSIGTTSSTMWIAGNSTQDTGIRCYTVGIAPCNSSGVYQDNSRDLGSLTVRWDDIYATNGTIQTSDFNEKQDIAELSDAEQRVAVACKGLLRKFRWKDSVAEKGDEARTHFGIIAQDLQAAFAAEGLDAGDYAMFISTTWTDEETNEEKTRMGVRYSELLAFIIAAI